MRDDKLSRTQSARRPSGSPGGRLAAAILILWTFPAAAAELGPEDASKHVGEVATVCGVVASTKFLSGSPAQPTLLNLGKPYPDQTFTATIFGDDRAKFGAPEKSLAGKRICVTGKIQDFRGIPEIVVNDPKQLTQ